MPKMPRNKTKNRKKTAGAIFPPPFIYLISIAAGIIVNFTWRMKIFPGVAMPRVILGIVIISIAISIFINALKTLERAGTPIRPDKPSLKIVKAGPYRYSRNPVYLAFSWAQIGIALLLNNAWILIALIPALLTVYYGVILREEKYLEEKFGKEYLRYKKSVRRWI